MVLSSTSRKLTGSRRKKTLAAARSRRRRQSTSTSSIIDDGDPYSNTSVDKHRHQLHARGLDSSLNHNNHDRPTFRRQRSSFDMDNPYQHDERERMYAKKKKARRKLFPILLLVASILLYQIMVKNTSRAGAGRHHNDRGHGHGHGHGHGGNASNLNIDDQNHAARGASSLDSASGGDAEFPHLHTNAIRRIIPNKSPEDKIEIFLSWLRDNGANISPHVSLASFEDYGGYGLIAVKNEDEKESGGEEEEDHVDEDEQNENVLSALDEMFTIPKSIIVSAKSILEEYNSIHNRNKKNNSQSGRDGTTHSHSHSHSQYSYAHQINTRVKQSFPHSTMVQQDIIIAMHLMVECTLGTKSRFEPYISILPSDTIPRLDTFQASELKMLNDGQLAQLSMMQRRTMTQLWNDDVFQSLFGQMVSMAKERHGIKATTSRRKSMEENDKCLSYDAFHKFVTIVSSRAMVLHGVKYLTPLAGMANYQPRDTRTKKDIVNDDNETRDQYRHHYPFTLFHEQNRDGSITVRADRDVRAGEQIFEDYGALDNSLYLEAHGFVPHINPHHCASIPAKHLIKPSEIHLGGKDIDHDRGQNAQSTNSTLADVMVNLKLLPPNPDNWDTSLPDLCVMDDGSMDDHMAIKYLNIAALHLPGEVVEKQRMKCLRAQSEFNRRHHTTHTLTTMYDEEQRDRDLEMVELQCVSYKGAKQLRQRLIQSIARRTYCDQTMSWEEDAAMLHSLHNLHDDVSMQMELALKFRVAEKKVLARLTGDFEFSVESCENLNVLHMNNFDVDFDVGHDFRWASTRTADDSETKIETMDAIEKLNTFIDGLDLPHHRIKAAYVGGGMRVGVVATEDIKESDIYLAMNSASVISVETAMATLKNRIPLTKTYAYIDGGADALIWFILHEKFVAKQESEWFPYIQMLPTVEDIREVNPLYFEDEIFDFMAGSDLRLKLIEHQKRVFQKFEIAAEDIRIVSAFGTEIFTRDNFLWAYSIVHSRSIWWNGERHLVPLLDLVNCAELKDEHGKTASAHTTIFIENLAITQATSSFKEGEQLFENYAQPNYIYFMYHGFLLEENSHDCAFLRRGLPQSLDKGTSERLAMNGLSSTAPTFCIRDRETLDPLANFLRVIHKLPGNDNMGLQSDVLEFVRDEFEYRLKRFEEIGDRFETKSEFPYSIQSMRKIIETEQELLRNALELVRNYESLEGT